MESVRFPVDILMKLFCVLNALVTPNETLEEEEEGEMERVVLPMLSADV